MIKQIVALVLLFVISCVPAPTPAPTQVIAREPTQTPTPAPTPAPTKSRLRFEFFSGFENGFTGFDGNAIPTTPNYGGAQAEIIDDPTGAKKGKVLQGTISGAAVEQTAGGPTYRAHPSKSFAFQPFPCRVEEDIWMSRQVFDDIIQRRAGWYSHLSLFDNESVFHPSVTTYVSDTRHMLLDIKGTGGAGVFFPSPLREAPQFTPETWHRMAVEVDSASVAHLYQEDRLVTEGKLQPTSRNGIEGVHGGPIYGAPTFTLGGYVLVDNFRVTCL